MMTAHAASVYARTCQWQFFLVVSFNILPAWATAARRGRERLAKHSGIVAPEMELSLCTSRLPDHPRQHGETLGNALLVSLAAGDSILVTEP